MKGLKKNLAAILIAHPDAELFCFDEARFGTHSKLGHGWFPKGSRTGVKVSLGYQNFYVYGAANPTSGKKFILLLPNVNTACMNVFLEEFALELGDKKAIVIMDGAGWHKSKDLLVPKNIIPVFLPAYSPELNPIERLWLHIKHHVIRNRIYESVSKLEDEVCAFINNLDLQTVSSICALNYLSSYM